MNCSVIVDLGYTDSQRGLGDKQPVQLVDANFGLGGVEMDAATGSIVVDQRDRGRNGGHPTTT
ncbi:hypothetical protein [Mycobacterium uberis]|uniref:hypothetical protein n=1 Tax=Mycobacterium uberis TaxID=2162698 RepID=UPI0010590C58|nr:hypothetical protein [Mycobacterium uberis]